MIFFIEKTDSPRNIPDIITPKTGIENANIVTFPTGLYFNSSVHILKAAADSAAKYKRRQAAFKEYTCTRPHIDIPIIIISRLPNNI